VGAAILIPRIGVAQFAIGLTAGVLIASLTLDHTGAFGNEVRAVSAVRVAGAGLALVGAFLVRFEA
jgi:transporter family-2 protein